MTKSDIWSKKADELTVGENMKIAGGVFVVATAVSIAIPLAVFGALSAYEKLSEKLKTRKFAKELNKTNA